MAWGVKVELLAHHIQASVTYSRSKCRTCPLALVAVRAKRYSRSPGDIRKQEAVGALRVGGKAEHLDVSESQESQMLHMREKATFLLETVWFFSISLWDTVFNTFMKQLTKCRFPLITDTPSPHVPLFQDL